ncbi:uncharacterized protein LOC144584917 isoform X2 [Pogona vitticeps]
MAVTKTNILFLLAGILQSISGSAEDEFSYEDYYDATSTYDYTNNSSIGYPEPETEREGKKTSRNSSGVLHQCHWMFVFSTLPHFLYFLQKEFYMSF